MPLALAAVMSGQEPETTARWQFLKDVQAVPGSGLVMVDLDRRQTLGNSREDLGDLRLRDADGREIPYALRIRRKIDRRENLEARTFDSATRDSVAEVSVDLGEDPPPHNEVEIKTSGNSFRRPVRVFGSDDGTSWVQLGEPGFLFRFQSPGFDVDEASVQYPESRRRFLRAEVEADSETDESAPSIQAVSVRLAVEVAARDSEFPLLQPSFQRQATRERGRAASEYVFNLEDRLPVRGLRLDAVGAEFSRPYRLEVPGDRTPRTVAAGRLARGSDETDPFVTIEFQETATDRLILTVTDDRNPPLEFGWGAILIAARELIFDPSQGRMPFRLELGNANAEAPHYDFDATVPVPPTDGRRGSLGALRPNPDYDPSQEPLGDRAPWLVYVALGAACLALFVVLRGIQNAPTND